jgi:hypothetical protein
MPRLLLRSPGKALNNDGVRQARAGYEFTQAIDNSLPADTIPAP